MKSGSFRTFVLVVAAVVLLLACGKKLSESERSYAEACVKINNNLSQKGEASRKLCECTAAIVVPKLTQGELNAYVNSVDLMGKVMTPEAMAQRGFTLAEFTSLGQKRQASFPEMRKTCGGESF
ncbi:MAG TPA: hypothetical protein VGN95_17270 [Pyrinomonadaceae bacterium]|jgi:hypothetical protein|nr:hypothetical protein [Pyrinomonadaceae bacterium]